VNKEFVTGEQVDEDGSCHLIRDEIDDNKGSRGGPDPQKSKNEFATLKEGPVEWNR